MSFITKMFGGKTPDTSQAQYTPANVTGPTGGVNWSGGNATLTLSDALKQLYDQYVSEGKVENIHDDKPLSLMESLDSAGLLDRDFKCVVIAVFK